MSEPARRAQLMTRPDCPLCDEMKALLERVARDVEVSWTAVDIRDDPVLEERFGNDVPVLLIDGEVSLQHRASEIELRALLSRLR